MNKILSLGFSLVVLAAVGCSKESSHGTSEGSVAPRAQGELPPTPSAPPKDEPGNPPASGGQTSGGSSTTTTTTTTTQPVCQSGPIGTYNGYIARADGSFVPLSLVVDFRKGGDTGIPLRATMRVGFLGGVTIGTETVNYNWTNNYVTIVFTGTSASGGTSSTTTVGTTAGAATTTNTGGSNPTVQIKGTLSCGTFVGGQISGNLSGLQNVVLSKTEKSLFDDNKRDYQYALNFASNPTNTGYLTFTSRVFGMPSGDTSDLPYVPALSATVQFSGFGATVEGFDSVLYDPLRGKLELTIAGYSLFVCPLTASDRSGEISAPSITCDVTMGASTVDQVAVSTAPAKVTKPALRPPHYFKGIYYPSPNLPYIVVASLDYEDKDGKNPVKSIFASFPVLDLKVTVCDTNGKAIERVTYETVSVDPISSVADFRVIKTTGDSFDLLVKYQEGFKSFTGEVVSAQTSPGAQNARYVLTALPDQTKWRTCATP